MFMQYLSNSMTEEISLDPSAAELEENLRWILKNIFESQSHPKIPTVLTELGHADFTHRFQ